MKRALYIVSILLLSIVSCKKDKSSSSGGTKMKLMTEKPWALVSQEEFRPITQTWALTSSGEINRLHYFYTDGTVEKKNSSSGTPSSYPIVGRGTWGFADNETALTHSYFSFMKSPVVIESLTSTKLVIIKTENTAEALKYRDTYTHP